MGNFLKKVPHKKFSDIVPTVSGLFEGSGEADGSGGAICRADHDFNDIPFCYGDGLGRDYGVFVGADLFSVNEVIRLIALGIAGGKMLDRKSVV